MGDSRPRTNARAPFEVRIAKVFADPLRIKILAELNTREMSPKQFFEEFGGGSIPRVSKHFDVLVAYDWLDLVETKSGGKRRGATEHFYRATGPAVFDNNAWSHVPDSMKGLFTWKTFEHLAERIREAMEAGTIDAREDRHFTWTPLLLDQPGWESVVGKVDGVFEFAFEEQGKAKSRLSKSGEEPIRATLVLAMFESPKDSKKAP